MERHYLDFLNPYENATAEKEREEYENYLANRADDWYEEQRLRE
jgi:hypothetical protein